MEGKGAALTSPGPVHCVLSPSARRPPAAAQPLRPAGHSGRSPEGAGMQLSPLLPRTPHGHQAAGPQAICSIWPRGHWLGGHIGGAEKAPTGWK